jgi:4-amino-4-deoxy-L-arabinose transferase-like glycosyltransferase
MLSAIISVSRARGFKGPPSFVAYGVVLLAFGLRLYRLLDQNIWWDEGWTLWLARFDLVSIALRTAGDEHPPLHYWLMHFWSAGLGSSAFAGRLFSVFFGVLMIAVFYRLARHSGGGRLGILAALLLTLSRFHILWSQDIKNYTLAGFFCAPEPVGRIRSGHRSASFAAL